MPAHSVCGFLLHGRRPCVSFSSAIVCSRIRTLSLKRTGTFCVISWRWINRRHSPQNWNEVRFPRGSFIHELLHKVSLMLGSKTKKKKKLKNTFKKSCSDGRQQRSEQRQSWNILDCDSWILVTVCPLAFLIMPLCSIYIFPSSSCWCFLLISSHSPPLSLTLAARQTCPRRGRLSACHVPQRDAASLIMRRWHHYKSNHGAVINTGLIKKTGWWTN